MRALEVHRIFTFFSVLSVSACVFGTCCSVVLVCQNIGSRRQITRRYECSPSAGLCIFDTCFRQKKYVDGFYELRRLLGEWS